MYEIPTSSFSFVANAGYAVAEVEWKTLTLSINVRFVESIRAIWMKGLGRWLEPRSTVQANHSSLFVLAAPVIRGSARSSQRRPSAVVDRYPSPPSHRATATDFCVGAFCPSLHENTASVLVSWCAAKKAISSQFWATRKLWKLNETN